MNKGFCIFSILSLLLFGAGSLTAQSQLKFDKEGCFKVLQVTDMHINLKKGQSEECFELLKEAIGEERPDLVVFTGDQVTELNPEAVWKRLVEQMNESGVAWTMVFGNHDHEQGMSREEIYEIVKGASCCLMSKGEVKGVGNMVRRILKEMYQPTSEGICGNEDCGQMSAWYITSSLGLYPVCPGSNEFILTSPLFAKATIRLANGKQLAITANEPDENIYIRRVNLNGKEIDRCFLTYDELMQGGELKFELLGEPCTEWAVPGAVQPYSMTRDEQVAIPYVSRNLYLFEDSGVFEIGCTTPEAELCYTLDGSEPTPASPLYRGAIRLDNSAVLRVRGFKKGCLPSELLELPAVKAVYSATGILGDLSKGFRYDYYEGKFTSVADMEKIQPKESGYMPVVSIDKTPSEDHYGYIWVGWIRIPSQGVYEFELKSDDGSVLYIGDRKVVDNDGSHAAVSAFGRIALEQGYHPFRLLYFEDYEGQFLEWKWKKVSRVDG